MPTRQLRRVARLLSLAAAIAVSTTACSKSETAQARGRDEAAKPVAVEAVREETVNRAVEVVGTLAAVDDPLLRSKSRQDCAAALKAFALQ